MRITIKAIDGSHSAIVPINIKKVLKKGYYLGELGSGIYIKIGDFKRGLNFTDYSSNQDLKVDATNWLDEQICMILDEKQEPTRKSRLRDSGIQNT